jgi:putative SOS response-associated peptidase YedK
MSKIHNVKKRMPTILEEDAANAWVNENLNDAQIVELAKHQIKDIKMNAYTVAKNFQQTENPCEKVDYKIFTPQTLF